MSMTSQIVGNYAQPSAVPCEYLILAFSPLSAPLRDRWRNNGLSADFLGDYVITFLPKQGSKPGAGIRQNELRHAVTYIANELLENAMKYHQPDADIPISIRLELTSEEISVSASNAVAVAQSDHYRRFIESALEGDPGDLLVKQLEDGARRNQPNDSGLGLLTMMHDYDAVLGWCFDLDPTGSVLMVTTRAVLAL
jgi:hypothetical protein